jgi:hypothetical protein
MQYKSIKQTMKEDTMNKMIKMIVFLFVFVAIYFSFEQLAFKNSIFADSKARCCEHAFCNSRACSDTSTWKDPNNCSNPELKGICSECIDRYRTGLLDKCGYTHASTYCVKANGDRYYGADYEGPPDAPQNLTVTESQDEHPLLSWDSNSEPDLDEYKIYRQKDYEGWNMIGTTTNTTYTDSDVTTTYLHGDDFYYKITAIDVNDDESGFSNTVWIEARWEKRIIVYDDTENNDVELYNNTYLANNYPNPFNPSTVISYQLSENTYVNLIICNSLGQKVKELVNSHQGKGLYNVEFNAGNLPSGLYFYKLQAGEFRDVKRMLLEK